MVAKKPPLGWNSWDCYGAAVTEKEVRRNAEFMSKNLKQYGWEYVVVDIQWSEPTADSHEYHPFATLCMDEYGRLMPAVNRFPSAADGAGFAPLAEYVHSLGLKFGIHIMRGIPRAAVHADLPICGSSHTAREIASTNSICYWNTDMYGVNGDAEGAADYYNSLFELYASWGVDFIKVDDICREFHDKEIRLIHDAIENCGREMVLSLSPGMAPIEHAEFFKQYSNMWRITDDFWDKWELLYAMFERAEKWCIHAGSGHWPDADMLPIGPICQDYSLDNRSKFTQDEQITMLTLWNMMRSPLIIGGEMTGFDEFTMSLLTNPEVLSVGQNSYGAHPVFRRSLQSGEWIVWVSYDTNGANVAVFRTDDGAEQSDSPEISVSECGLDWANDGITARNLWKPSETVTVAEGSFRTGPMAAHSAKLFRFDISLVK